LRCLDLDLPLLRAGSIPGEGPSAGFEKRAQAVAEGLRMPLYIVNEEKYLFLEATR
jgi:hypothetical protein